MSRKLLTIIPVKRLTSTNDPIITQDTIYIVAKNDSNGEVKTVWISFNFVTC